MGNHVLVKDVLREPCAARTGVSSVLLFFWGMVFFIRWYMSRSWSYRVIVGLDGGGGHTELVAQDTCGEVVLHQRYHVSRQRQQSCIDGQWQS